MSGSDEHKQPSSLTRRRFLMTTAGLIAAATLGPTRALGVPGGGAGGEGAGGEAGGLPPRDLLFDADWRFHRGDAPGAERPDFDDAGWRRLDLPHDWSIEDLPGAPERPDPWRAPPERWSATARRGANLEAGEFLVTPEVPERTPGGPPARVGPFDPAASEGGWSTAWLVGGTGWYRKHFELPRPDADEDDDRVGDEIVDEVVEIRFDGSYLVTDVWLNGVHVGTHDHGHNGFAFDLTPHLAHGAQNVIAVRVQNLGFSSRWYNGSGLYRHVWLTRTRTVRVPLWGVFVQTPVVTAARATTLTRVEVENRAAAAEVEVEVVLRGPDGQAVGRGVRRVAVPAASTVPVLLEADIASPQLWRPGAGVLYGAEVTLTVAGRPSDRVAVPFGVRTVACNAEQGLLINDEPVKLRGAAVHADNGLLGAAAVDAAEVRKAELLQAAGFNAVRASHNLFAPAFLDACDRLGLVVIEETFDVWNEGKFGRDLGATRFKTRWQGDVAAMVRRDRNRPGIVFWQIGNEIPERDEPLGVETARRLQAEVRALDPTRLLTASLTIGSEGAAGEPSRRGLDVVGYNYLTASFEPDHAAYPDVVFMATEDYARDTFESWALAEKHPWMIGQFCWTAIDFLGEVGVGASQLRRDGERPPESALPFSLYFWDYPFYVAGCGEMDILGHKRPASYYRDVLWRRSPLELFVQRPTPPGFHEERTEWGWPDELPSWTWPGPNPTTLTVRAYTAGDEVALLLNGREVGRRRVTPADKLTAAFAVAYEPGELVAVAYRGGTELARKTLATVGVPARLRLRAERAHVAATPGNLAYLVAEVCDADGNLVPDAQVPLTFALSGPARLAAAGAANPRGLESLRDGRCTTYQGVAQAILAPTGRRGAAVLEAHADGLASARVRVTFG